MKKPICLSVITLLLMIFFSCSKETPPPIKVISHEIDENGVLNVVFGPQNGAQDRSECELGTGDCLLYGAIRFTEEDAGSGGTPVSCSGSFRIILVNFNTWSITPVSDYCTFINTSAVNFTCNLDPVSDTYAYFLAFDGCIEHGVGCTSFWIHNFFGKDNNMHNGWANPWTYSDCAGAFEGCVPLNSDPDVWSTPGCQVDECE